MQFHKPFLSNFNHHLRHFKLLGMSNPNHHSDIPYLAGTPAGGPSIYPSELVPHNRQWHVDSHPYPGAGFPPTTNPDYVYGPRFAVPLLPNF